MVLLPGETRRRRELLFVDREAELALFREALSIKKLEWNILEIRGVAGIGKTFLLQRCLDMCQEMDVPATLIDAYAPGTELIGGFTQSAVMELELSGYEGFFRKYRQLHTEYARARGEVPDISPSTQAADGSDRRLPLDARTPVDQEFVIALNAMADKYGRLVLAVDSYELLLGTSAERWLREFFFPQASVDILIVVSGRTRLGPEWQRWQPITHSIELQPFSTHAMVEFIRRRVPAEDYDESALAEVLEFVQGHPLALTLLTDLIPEGVSPGKLSTTVSEISTALIERLTQFLDPSAKVMLEALSMLASADEDILKHVLGDESTEVSTQLRLLSDLSFVRVTSEGSLELHDAVKNFVAEGLRTRSPLRYADLHQRACIYYLNRLDMELGEGDWGGAAQEALKHRLAVDEAEGLRLFRKLFQSGLDLGYGTACRLVLHTLREYAFNRGALGSEVDLLDTKLTTRLNQTEKTLTNWESRNSMSLMKNLANLLGLVPARVEQSDKYPGWVICTLHSTTLFRDTSLPTHLPVLLYDGMSLPESAPQQVRAILGDYPDSPTQVALLVLYEEAIDGVSLHSLVTKMRQVYAIDLIQIQKAELLEIVFSEEPQRELRRKVVASVDLRSVSPFVITGPTPDNVFFGREDSLRELTEHAMDGSYAVVGGRRFGKTSILLRLHHVRLPAAGLHALYHDCSTTPTHDALFAAPIHNWCPKPPPAAPATFNDLLQFPLADKPLVLLLDEADKLVPADCTSGWPLFNALRALANSGRAQVVLSGERTLRAALRDPKSPLFNFVHEILLGPLDYRAVEELVTRPMKQLEIELESEKVIVSHIWSFTSGHPNIVQRLCRRLIERLNERGDRLITLDDVNAVIEDPGFQRDDFLSTYWEAATPLERIISLLMADDGQIRTLRTVRRSLQDHCDLRPSAREIDGALQRLVDLRSILKRTPRGYEFAVQAFPRVVAGTMTLNDMLMILTEEYEEQVE